MEVLVTDESWDGNDRAKRSQVAGPVGGQADGQAVVEQVLCASGADAVAGEQTGIAHQTFCMDFLAQARAAQGVFPDERLPIVELDDILPRIEPLSDKLSKQGIRYGVVFQDDSAGKAPIDDLLVSLHVAECTTEFCIAHCASEPSDGALPIDCRFPGWSESLRAIDAVGHGMVEPERVQCR